jgi:hypothetical protein
MAATWEVRCSDRDHYRSFAFGTLEDAAKFFYQVKLDGYRGRAALIKWKDGLPTILEMFGGE